MELFIFACFHAQEGTEDAVAAAIRAVSGPTQQEPGCLAYGAHRAKGDPRLIYIRAEQRGGLR